MWFLYILLCKDGSLYTGISNNVEKRFSEHKNGKGGRYTRSHKPIRLVYQEQLRNHTEALRRECEIKSWTRAKKIKVLEFD
ncbi:GIY-YIG nuclease family protein [Candidatus Daviesbacteria bacterium]|nr:GIY-YIG nuclease family protein [Candidatus Daviesbacteria bacterium]